MDTPPWQGACPARETEELARAGARVPRSARRSRLLASSLRPRLGHDAGDLGEHGVAIRPGVVQHPVLDDGLTGLPVRSQLLELEDPVFAAAEFAAHSGKLGVAFLLVGCGEGTVEWDAVPR